MPPILLRLRHLSAVIVFAIATAGVSWAADGSSSLSVRHIGLQPTEDGFYDATVGLIVADAKLGKAGEVAFNIVIAHVHDADEAISRVHDPLKTLSGDLQRGYFDLRRAP